MMQQNATTFQPSSDFAFSEASFPWTSQTEEAALLVAEGKLTEAKMAAKLKIDRTTLWRWKKHPEFARRVQETVDAFRSAIRAEGIAVLENRLVRLNEHWEGMRALVRARADDAVKTKQSNKKAVDELTAASRQLGASDVQIQVQVADLLRDLPTVAPGMETGLVVRGYKVAGGQTVEEFSFDAALLKELRGHEEQAAKELGQWSDRAETRDYDMSQFNDAELDRLAAGEPIDHVLASSRRRAGEAASGRAEPFATAEGLPNAPVLVP